MASPTETIIIGIAGGTGSGKTTVTEQIATRLNRSSTAIIPQDAYYKDRSHLSEEERKKINYDHPSAFDTELLIRHLRLLKKGLSIESPVYDFETHTRRNECVTVPPAKVVVLEGLLIFADQRLRNLMDLKIFVDSELDVAFIRRLQRDIKERGRSLESVVKQYLATVKPMHVEFVEKGKNYADIVISGGGHNQKDLDRVVAQIKSMLDENAPTTW